MAKSGWRIRPQEKHDPLIGPRTKTGEYWGPAEVRYQHNAPSPTPSRQLVTGISPRETYSFQGPDGKIYPVYQDVTPQGWERKASRFDTPLIAAVNVRDLAYQHLHPYSNESPNYQVPVSVLKRLREAKRNLTEYFDTGIGLETNSTFQLAKYRLEQRYPASEGWELTGNVRVQHGFRYGDVDVVARRGNEVQFIALTNGKEDKFVNKATNTMLSYMWQKEHPTDTVTGNWSLSLFGKKAGIYRNLGNIDERLLNDVYGIKLGPIQVTKPINLDKLRVQQAKQGLGGMTQFFPKAAPGSSHYDTHVAFDIETDGAGRPIQIAAYKFGWNTETNALELIDTFERYYKPSDEHRNNMAETVHEWSTEALMAMREATKAKYSETYGDTERAALHSFFAGSKLVGQNILEFDLKQLFSYEQIQELRNNGIIDTLQLARNYRPNKKGVNDLEALLKAVTGKTPGQLGLRHHGAIDDVIMLEIVLLGMGARRSELGEITRKLLGSDIPYVTTTEGPDAYSGGGGYLNMRTGELQSAEEILGMAGRKAPINPGSYNNDFNTSIDGILDNTAEAISRFAEVMETQTEAMERTIAMLPSASRAFAETANTFGEKVGLLSLNSRMATTARLSRMNPEAAKKVVRALGIGDTESEALLSGADILRADRPITPEKVSKLRVLRAASKLGILDEFLEGDIEDAWAQEGEEGWYAREDIRDRIRAEKKRQRKTELDDLRRQRKSERERILLDDKRNSALNQYAFNRDEILKAKDINELTDAMITAREQTRMWSQAIDYLSNIPYYNFNRWATAMKEEVGGITSASKGLMPNSLHRVLSRGTAAFSNVIDLQANRYNYAKNMIDVFGIPLTTIGGTLGTVVSGGNPVGAIIGTSVGAGIHSLAAGITQTIGQRKEYQIRQYGETIQRNLNGAGMLVEYIRAPFSILGSAIKATAGLFGKLRGHMTGFMAAMQQIGTPWTMLTGADSYAYRRSRYGDIAFGLQAGATNSSWNTWASAQQGLYTMGQLDTNRVVASAMLGEFSNVYGLGEDSEAQYARFMNNTLNRLDNASPEERKRLMWLAGQVDPNAPQVLSRMQYIRKVKGNLSYEDMTKAGAFDTFSHPLNDTERGKFYVASAQWQMQKQGFQDSGMRIAERLWSGYGNTIATSLNTLLDALVNGGNWKQAARDMGTEIGKLWEKVKGVASELKSGMGIDGNIFDGLWSAVRNGAKMAAISVLTIWHDLINNLIQSSTKLFALIDSFHLGIDPSKLASELAKGKRGNILKAIDFGWDPDYALNNFKRDGTASSPLLKDSAFLDWVEGLDPNGFRAARQAGGANFLTYLQKGSWAMNSPNSNGYLETDLYGQHVYWLPNSSFGHDMAEWVEATGFGTKEFANSLADGKIRNSLLASGVLRKKVKDKTGTHYVPLTQADLDAMQDYAYGDFKATATAGNDALYADGVKAVNAVDASADRFVKNVAASSGNTKHVFELIFKDTTGRLLGTATIDGDKVTTSQTNIVKIFTQGVVKAQGAAATASGN